jgi:hypothetical protein
MSGCHKCYYPEDCDCGLLQTRVGCQGSGCQQGRTPEACDCKPLHIDMQALGEKCANWFCAVGIIVVIALIAKGWL